MSRSAGLMLLFIFLFPPFGFSSAEEVLNQIKLPPGFTIEIFSSSVPGARAMVLGEKGTLFVGSMRPGNVYAIAGADGNHAHDEVLTVASGLVLPVGVDVYQGDLYVSEVSRILRFEDIETRLHNPPEPQVVQNAFPEEMSHGWKFIRFGPDNKLYVPVGAPCNVCLSDDDRFDTIMRMNPDGSSLEIFARGIRNTVGFDWHPESQVLWFTDNGRDWLGDDLPPDELNRAPKKGMHFGFPFCHGTDIRDPQFGQNVDCSRYQKPKAVLGAHVAALGMRFYKGDMFPANYKHQIFIAEHGSWNRSTPVGSRIVLARLKGEEVEEVEVFAEGWLKDGHVYGRPVDVQEMSDGSLLVSDDYAGAIYRIQYRQEFIQNGEQ